LTHELPNSENQILDTGVPQGGKKAEDGLNKSQRELVMDKKKNM
jgi:hypothetical protein